MRPRVLTLVAVLVVACSSPAAAPGPTPNPAAATATPAPTPQPVPGLCGDCWPLVGRPANGGLVSQRSLLVKIDNAPLARPQYGLNQADIVFETLVEGFVTRLAAVYHSNDPKQFAPVRSARLTDRSLAPMFRAALVYSGTSAHEKPLIQKDAREGKYLDLSADYYSFYGRLGNRPAPSNMVVTPQALRAEIQRVDPRPVEVPQWAFIAGAHPPTAGGMSGGLAAVELTIPYRDDFALATYKWDATKRTYERWQNSGGKPVRAIDALENQPIAAANVIVLYTEITPVPEIVDASGAVSYDARLTGTGRASIFRDGLRVEATWSRADDNAPFTFKTAAGEQVLLAGGQTWVHPVPTDWQVTSH